MSFKTSVYFNNFDLSAIPGVSVYDHDFISPPTRVINKAKLARADKSVLTSAEYSEKTVTVDGFVCGINKSDTEDAFETMKGILQIPEGTLRMEQAGLQIEYIGTLNGITHDYYGNTLRFTLSFICSDPIGRNRLTTNLLASVSNTTADHTYQFTVLGSFKARPNIKLTYSAITGGTGKTIQVLNSDSQQGIKITGNFTTGDIIDIDVDNQTVTQNATLIDYEGVFPEFYPGLRNFQYIDDMTARTVLIDVTYNKRYA